MIMRQANLVTLVGLLVLPIAIVPVSNAASPEVGRKLPDRFQGPWVDADLSGAAEQEACAENVYVFDEDGGSSVSGHGIMSVCEGRSVRARSTSATLVAICGVDGVRTTKELKLEGSGLYLVETTRYGSKAPLVSRYKRCSR